MKENENTKISPTSLNKNTICQETNNNLNNTESENSSLSQDNTEYDSTDDPTLYQKPRKIQKKNPGRSNENDDALRDLTNAAIDICTQLQLDSTSHGNVGSKSVEQAFSEFIAFSLQGMQEPERNIRRNKIYQDLTAPLDQLFK